MSRTLQFRRLGTAALANTTGANGELIINSTNKTLTVHDGVTPGGFIVTGNTSANIDQFARNTANNATTSAQAATNLAQSAYNYANTISATGIDQFARNTANSATNLAQSAYNYANTIGSSATGIDQFARNTANTASNNITILQGVNNTQNTNIASATNLAQLAFNNSNTKFSSSGGQISGNVIIVGDLDVTDNTVVTNAIEANNVIIDGSLKTGLSARSSVVLPHLIAQFASNSASYVQVNQQNINPEGSADWVVTADNGTDTDYFIDLGLHGSQAFDKVLTPYDGYLFVQGSTIGQSGGNLIIGTTSSFSGLETKFVAGGYESNNVIMKIGTYGANVTGRLNVSSNISASNISVGRLNVSSNIIASNISAPLINTSALQSDSTLAKSVILNSFHPNFDYGNKSIRLSSSQVTSSFAIGAVNNWLRVGGNVGLFDSNHIVIAPDYGFTLGIGGVIDNSTGLIPAAPTFISSSYITDMYSSNVHTSLLKPYSGWELNIHAGALNGFKGNVILGEISTSEVKVGVSNTVNLSVTGNVSTPKIFTNQLDAGQNLTLVSDCANTPKAWIYTSNGNIVFPDLSVQTTAYQNIVWQTANSAVDLAQAAFNAANTANGGGNITGNISVLATNSAINFVANSSGDGVGYSTIQLVPDTNATQDQYIVIDPTAPSHIHIRAGGVQDSSGAQLFLGGEKQYVRVTDNQGIRLQNEETNDNYYYYSNTVQYVDGTWYEEGGNYFIQFTTNDSQMVTDLSNFASGSPNEVILYWNNGVEVISNTMISVLGFWQGIGNIYTAQVSATLPANNTTLTAIEFHLFTTRTNYIQLENNDFTVDVYDDVRINGRDYFSLRNWSTTDPIEIVTDYDNQSHAWEFGANGVLYLPSPSANSEISSRDNLILTTNTDGFAAKKWLFDTNGVLTFPNSTTQTGAAISITELKALVANCATYGDFQTAIANL